LAHTVAKHHWLGRWQRWRNRRCIVASRFQADQLRSLGAGEVHVVPGGGLSREVRVPGRDEARRQLGWNERPVVGYLGHYSPAKGVGYLVEAFIRCQARAVLALAHSGARRLSRRSEGHLAALEKAGRLRQLGVVDSPTFLAACDVVVLPFVTSSVHHLPLVMIESFAAGTAVITTRVGGVYEPIEANGAGALAAAQDAADLARVIDRTLSDLAACHKMGRHARRLFERELCDEVFCARLTEILRGCRP
jgi:glycosyltransferase involved in cell wall biosynthesis